jgi:hypothetical protein
MIPCISSPHPRQLDYAKTPPPWYSRRLLRLAVLTSIVIASVFAGQRWLPPLWDSMQTFYWRRQAMAYTTSPNSVIYWQANGAVSPEDVCVPKAREMLEGYEGLWANVFLHSRSRPSGGQRLVIVDLADTNFFGLQRKVRFVTNISRSGSLYGQTWSDPATLGMPFEQNELFRLHAGQPDPADASHFTIEYEINSGSGTIDGWLQDDDTVKVKVRDGPARQP